MLKKLGISLAMVFILVIIIIVVISLSNKPIYKVTFNSDDSIYKIIDVKAKERVDEPNKPDKEGYEFVGWYLDEKKYDFDSRVTKDIELEAKWNLIEIKKYKVSFDSLGGNKINDIEVEEGKIISEIPNPEKEGYTFLGWYYQNKKYDFNTRIMEDISLVAKWKKD